MLCYIFWKKFFWKIFNDKKSRPTLKVFGRTISNHSIFFFCLFVCFFFVCLFLSFSGHFRTCGEFQKWFRGSKKMSSSRGRKNFADILRGNDFTADPKKSLYRYFRYCYYYYYYHFGCFFHVYMYLPFVYKKPHYFSAIEKLFH